MLWLFPLFYIHLCGGYRPALLEDRLQMQLITEVLLACSQVIRLNVELADDLVVNELFDRILPRELLLYVLGAADDLRGSILVRPDLHRLGCLHIHLTPIIVEVGFWVIL